MSKELADRLEKYAAIKLHIVHLPTKLLKEAIAALRSEPPGLRYKATVLWDDKTTVHEGVYPDRQEPVARDEADVLLRKARLCIDPFRDPDVAEEIDDYLKGGGA